MKYLESGIVIDIVCGFRLHSKEEADTEVLQWEQLAVGGGVEGADRVYRRMFA